MSYCRKGSPDSDVYVLGDAKGLVCMCCIMQPMHEHIKMHKDFRGTHKEILGHLNEHLDEGHKVPNRAVKRLKRELKEK